MSDMYERTKTTQYIVWWIPQVPLPTGQKAFEVATDSIEVARTLEDVLAKYDLYQFYNKIKPDYSNAGGTVVWDVGEGAYVDVHWDEEDSVPSPDDETAEQ